MMAKKIIQRSLYLFILFALSIGNAFAQQGSIKGNIIDGDTNEPMPSATVVIKAGDMVKGTASDSDGTFSISNLIPGDYIVEISFIGYQTIRFPKVTVKSGGLTPLVDIVLNSGSLAIDEVILIEKTNIIDYGDDSKINLDAKELENLPVQRNFGSIVKAMSTEVKVSEDGTEIHFRGARSDATAMMIDGVKVTGTNSNLPGAGIGNFRIFSGGVPAEYGDFTGGIIVVESKDYFSLYQQYLVKKKYEKALAESQEN